MEENKAKRILDDSIIARKQGTLMTYLRSIMPNLLRIKKEEDIGKI